MAESNGWGETIFVAVLAFIGALLGSYLSGYFNEKLWEKQFAYEQRKTIFNQRISLIDKTSKIINFAPKMKSAQSYLDLQVDFATYYGSCIKKAEEIGGDISKCPRYDDMKFALELNSKRSDLNAEFASTMQLVSIYFSDKTKMAVQKIANNQPWWQIDESLYKELIRSMNEELNTYN